MEPTPREQLPYTDEDVARATQRLREICGRLPEVTERLSHGSVTFFVRGKRTVAYLTDDHHGDRRLALVCAAPPGVQAEVIANEPDRFFRPPYVGHRGWIGLRPGRFVSAMVRRRRSSVSVWPCCAPSRTPRVG